MYWDGAHWWAWLPMSLFMVSVWGLLIWGLIRLAGDRRPGEPRRATALEILDGRLARGEIDLDEYRDRRSLIEDGGRRAEDANRR